MSPDKGPVSGGPRPIMTRVPKPYESLDNVIVMVTPKRSETRPHGDLIPRATRNDGLTNRMRRELRETHRVGLRQNSVVIAEFPKR